MYLVRFYYEIRVKDSVIPMRFVGLTYDTKFPFVPTMEINVDGLPGIEYPSVIRFIVYDNIENIFKCILTETDERRASLKNHVDSMMEVGWKINSENKANMEMILNA